MKWYEQKYVNHRDWILDNLEFLNLNHKELTLVLVIDFLNEHHMEINMDLLGKKTGLKREELEQTISVLCARRYLEILASSKDVRFVLNGLFETETAREQNVLDAPLFDMFETEFRRTLTQKEMQKISDWNRTFERKTILMALREASTYQKMNIAYIESILLSWSAQGTERRNQG